MCHCRSDIAACSQPRGAAWPNLGYDTACSWKPQKGAAGCESVRCGERRDGGEAREGAGMPLTQPDRPPAFPPSPSCRAALAQRLPAPPLSSPAPPLQKWHLPAGRYNYMDKLPFESDFFPSRGVRRQRSQPRAPSS